MLRRPQSAGRNMDPFDHGVFQSSSLTQHAFGASKKPKYGGPEKFPKGTHLWFDALALAKDSPVQAVIAQAPTEAEAGRLESHFCQFSPEVARHQLNCWVLFFPVFRELHSAQLQDVVFNPQ